MDASILKFNNLTSSCLFIPQPFTTASRNLYNTRLTHNSIQNSACVLRLGELRPRQEAGDTSRFLVTAMGNESSQLEKHADIADRGGRVIGPPMSPTPSDDEQGRVFGPTMSPLPEENEADLAEPTPSKDRPRSPSKKRKKKQRESLDSALTLQAGVNDESHQSPKRKAKKRAKTNGTHDHLQEKETQEEVLNNGDTLHDDAPHTENVSKDDVAPMLLHSLLSDMKRKARLEAGIDDPNDPSNSDSPRFDAQPLLVSHAHGGTPPSAQHPTTNSILKYEPGLEEDADEQTIFPSSQLNWKGRLDMHSQASATEPMHFKRESSENSDGEELGATRFADATRNPMAEVIHEDEPPSQLSWCHKDGLEAANMPMIDNRTAPEGHSHRASPELLPSQIKIEHESDSGLDFDSESDSPSAARFERMSGSRSRSASKASTSQAVRLADQDVGQIVLQFIQAGCANGCFVARTGSPCSTRPQQTVGEGNR